MTTRGETHERPLCALRMKCCNIFSVTSKSAITPSFIGRIAMMLPGVRPSISLASLPTASTLLVTLLMATIEGSLTTMPRPLANTRVFAVPRSMARSLEKGLNRFLSLIVYLRSFSSNIHGPSPANTSVPTIHLGRSELYVVLITLLGFVHGRIGQLDELLRLSSVLGKACNAKTRRQIDVCSDAAFEPVIRDSPSDSFGHLKRAFGRGLGQHQHELVAAVPGYKVGIPHRPGYDLGDFSQSCAPRTVAISIIDQLESIEIHKHY